MSIPTDSLHKCLAMLGIAMISGSFYFWWPMKVEADNDYAELVVLLERYQDAFKVMADSANAAIAMVNSVHGDRSKLDKVQLDFIDRKIAEAEPASNEAKQILNETLKPLRLAQVRHSRFILASWVLGLVAVVGLIFSSYGFYKWGKSENSALA